MAYELLDKKNDLVYENNRFWKFIPNVNFHMMKIELLNTTQPEQFVILKKFIQMVCF
jgi:hypothetical protein